jgi:hypothetical protein
MIAVSDDNGAGAEATKGCGGVFVPTDGDHVSPEPRSRLHEGHADSAVRPRHRDRLAFLQPGALEQAERGRARVQHADELLSGCTVRDRVQTVMIDDDQLGRRTGSAAVSCRVGPDPVSEADTVVGVPTRSRPTTCGNRSAVSHLPDRARRSTWSTATASVRTRT